MRLSANNDDSLPRPRYPFRTRNFVTCPYCNRLVRPTVYKRWDPPRFYIEIENGNTSIHESYLCRCPLRSCRSTFQVHLYSPRESGSSQALKLEARKLPERLSTDDAILWSEPELKPAAWQKTPSFFAMQLTGALLHQPAAVLDFPHVAALLRAAVRDGYAQRCYHTYSRYPQNRDDEIREEYQLDIPVDTPLFFRGHWYHTKYGHTVSIRNALATLMIFGKVYVPNAMKRYCQGLITEGLVEPISFKSYEPTTRRGHSWLIDFAILHKDIICKILHRSGHSLSEKMYSAVVDLLSDPLKWSYCRFRFDSLFTVNGRRSYNERYTQFLDKSPSLENIELDYIRSVVPVALDIIGILSDFVNLFETARLKDVATVLNTRLLSLNSVCTSLKAQGLSAPRDPAVMSVLSIYLREMMIPRVDNIPAILRIRDKVNSRRALNDFRDAILTWAKELEVDRLAAHRKMVRDIRSANRALGQSIRCSQVSTITALLAAPMFIVDSIYHTYSSLIPTSVSLVSFLGAAYLKRKFRWHILGTL